MSSGEADAYTFTIKGDNTTLTSDFYYPYYHPNTSSAISTWSYSPVYYYQITCPRCGSLNWGEVEKITTCRGETQARNNRKVACGAKIKAVLEQVDFEVPVTKP